MDFLTSNYFVGFLLFFSIFASLLWFYYYIGLYLFSVVSCYCSTYRLFAPIALTLTPVFCAMTYALQEDAAREHPAVHGLHVQAAAGAHHAVVRGLQSLQAPARRGGALRDAPAHRHLASDGTGHGVSTGIDIYSNSVM